MTTKHFSIHQIECTVIKGRIKRPGGISDIQKTDWCILIQQTEFEQVYDFLLLSLGLCTFSHNLVTSAEA